MDAAQPERQRQRRPRQRVVRAPEHPRVAALLPVLGRLRRPVRPAVRAHLGGAEQSWRRRGLDPSGAARVSASFGAASGGPAPEAVGSAPDGQARHGGFKEEGESRSLSCACTEARRGCPCGAVSLSPRARRPQRRHSVFLPLALCSGSAASDLTGNLSPSLPLSLLW